MKLAGFFFLAVVAVASAQIKIYRPYVQVSAPVSTRRYSGGSDDGQYHPDDSGAYNPDGSGGYVHSDDPYKHLTGPNGGGDGGAGGAGGFGPGYKDKNRYYGDNSGQYNPDNSGAYVHSDNPYLHQGGGQGGSGSGQGGSGSGQGGLGRGKGASGSGAAFLPASAVISGLKTGSAAGLYDNRNYAIIRKVEQVEQDGYHYLYETENGILAEEQGHLDKKGSEGEAMQAKGFFKYTGPDNVIYDVQYTANEEGFKPVGAHLPQPPAIPEAILRSLAYQRSIGELE